MRSNLATLSLALTAIVTIWSGGANAHYAGYEQPKPILSDPIDPARDITAESNLYCLALAVFFEGGSSGETEEGQRHIAHVVAARARANRKIWGGGNICDVVFHKAGKVCQFSFACLPLAQRTVRGGAAWAYSKQIAQDEIEGRSGLEGLSLRYYMNASLTPAKNACRFRKEFVPVLQAGRHEFFREATRAERRELEKAEYEECKKFEASLKKKKEARSKKSKGDKGEKIAKHEGAAAGDKKSKVASNDKSGKQPRAGVQTARKQTAKKVAVAKR